MSGPQRDFAGRNGQVWFVGVIEGKKDPAKVGRMQVRIIGWHDENTNLLPTEDLPWAQISLPVNASRNLSLPKEGDWVHGFFLDGYAGQQPLIVGVIPGIVSKEPKVATGASDALAALEAQHVVETAKLDGMLAGQNDATLKQKRAAQQTVIDQKQAAYDAAVAKRDKLQATVSKTLLYNLLVDANLAVDKALVELNAAKAKLATYTTASSSAIEKQKKVVRDLQSEIGQLKINLNQSAPLGYCDVRPQAEVETAPKPIDGVVTDRKDEPSFPAAGREVLTNTGIAVSNNNRIHICDVVAGMDLGIASLKSKVSGLISEIRIAVEALFDGLSPNIATESTTQQAKVIKAKLDNLKKELKKITDEIAAVKAYIKYVQDLIDYINKLPAELQKMYAECLSQATKDLTTYTDKLKTLETSTTATIKTAAIATVTDTITVTENTTTSNSTLGTPP